MLRTLGQASAHGLQGQARVAVASHMHLLATIIDGMACQPTAAQDMCKHLPWLQFLLWPQACDIKEISSLPRGTA